MDDQRKPQKASAPALRFKGFDDPWEQRRLGELLSDLSTGRSVNSSEDDPKDGDSCILKTSCVTGNAFDCRERKKIVESEISLAKCPVEGATIVVSRMNTPDLVGSCGYCPTDMTCVFLPDRLWKIRVGDQVSPYFVYVILASDKCQERLRSAATGTSGSMKNISQEALLGLSIYIAAFSEQQKIGALFQRLDSLITLHQRERAGVI